MPTSAHFPYELPTRASALRPSFHFVNISCMELCPIPKSPVPVRPLAPERRSHRKWKCLFSRKLPRHEVTNIGSSEWDSVLLPTFTSLFSVYSSIMCDPLTLFSDTADCTQRCWPPPVAIDRARGSAVALRTLPDVTPVHSDTTFEYPA